MRLLKRRKRTDAAGQEDAGTETGGNGALSTDGADAEPVPAEAGITGAGATAVSPDGEDAAPADAAPADAAPTDAAPADAAPADAGASAMADGQAEEHDQAVPPTPAPAPDASAVVEEDGETRLSPSFYFEGLLKNERTPTREELDLQAEDDFRAAIAPSVGTRQELVPDASSPEEALQRLTERWGEPLPDPEAERLRGQDPFKRGPADTAVYYRIRRHFDRPTRHVGFGREGWRPPPGLAREALPRRGRSSRQALPSGQRSRRS